MQRRCRLADVGGKRGGLAGIQATASRNQLLERLARHVVVHNNVLVRQGVRGLDLRQPLTIERTDGRPNALVRDLERKFLANEGARAVDGHKLGHAARAVRQHPIDVIHVVEAHGMHDLLVVQTAPVSIGASGIPTTGVRNAKPSV